MLVFLTGWRWDDRKLLAENEWADTAGSPAIYICVHRDPVWVVISVRDFVEFWLGAVCRNELKVIEPDSCFIPLVPGSPWILSLPMGCV